MPDDTVTLRLEGAVQLAEFATAIGGFADLVGALSREVSFDATPPEWTVADLEYGSAIATIRGESATMADVLSVVRRYERVGDALVNSDLSQLSQRVREGALRIASVIDGHVESVVFETAKRDIQVMRRPVVDAATTPAPVIAATTKDLPLAYGAVEGRVQTLTNRGSLRFTLYDTLHDKAVSCYIEDGAQALMVDAWGRRAIVEGWLKRDPRSGRPLTIRDVRSVRLLPEPTNTWSSVRGLSKLSDGITAEAAVRRLRDA